MNRIYLGKTEGYTVFSYIEAYFRNIFPYKLFWCIIRV